MTIHNEKSPALPGEYLSFRLGLEEYGIPILTVQEIRGYQEPTRIANAPSYMKGVVNLRGVIVPIVDLRIQFGQDAAYNEITSTIVLNIGKRVIGIVVDSVSDVVALRAEEINLPPQMISKVDTKFVTGIATQVLAENKHRILILMDIERLIAFDAPDAAAVEEMLAA